jgi:protein SCO1/2
MRLSGVGLAAMLLLVTACRPAPPTREYRVIGQIIAIDRASSRVTLRHQDIPGFMPGMTMAFPVKGTTLLEGRTPGNLVDATLAVQGSDAWITRLDVVGTAPIVETTAPASGLSPGDVVPDAEFLTQDAARLRLAGLSGPTLITFVYTRCPFPEFCPTIETRLASLQRAVARETALRGTRLLAITIDPEHDTPAVLKAHASARGADPAILTYVTGDLSAVDAFGRQFGLAVSRQDSGAGIDHNLRTVVLDTHRRIVAVLTGSDWSVEDAMAALRKAAAS